MRFGAGGILTKTGIRAQIGIFGVCEEQITEQPKMSSVSIVFLYPGRVTKVQRRQHLVTQGAQALFYGFDMARMSKGLLSGLAFGNMGVEIPTYVRNDNSDALYQAGSVNTVANENG